ncbi:hypothetical protein ARMGADRAFT_1093542 [Armillaria gallica]|uniref:Uncharacterized protein n=1 Tax=Armillaria gallica TaxID=47427 RepID=A0A2H3CQJ5_ARMGA|nr:hypothetical protein ARMGADRAFT_1093542 [Armillaria gallica]
MQRTKFSLTRNARRAPNKWRTPSAIISGSRAPDYLNGATTVEISTEYRAQRNGALLQLLEIRGRDRSKVLIPSTKRASGYALDESSFYADSIIYSTMSIQQRASKPQRYSVVKAVVSFYLVAPSSFEDSSTYKALNTSETPTQTASDPSGTYARSKAVLKSCSVVSMPRHCKYGTVAKAETKAATSEVVKQDNET